MRVSPGVRAEGGAEAVLPHPEPVVHLAVDEHHRHVLGPSLEQCPVTRDVGGVPADAELGGDARHLSARVVAQVAAGLGQYLHPIHAHAPRSWPFATLPVTECGSSSTISTEVGHLNRASRPAACSMTDSGVGLVPGFGTTRARTVSPV